MSTQNTSQKSASGCLKAGAVIVVVFLVLALPLSLFFFDLGQAVFNQPLVKRIVTDEVVNSDLIPAALEWLSDRRAQERVASGEALTGITEPDIVLLMSFLDAGDWRQIKAEVLTDEILTDWTSVTVDGVYDWIDTEERNPQVSWSMQAFKDRVNSEHGTNSIVIAFDNLEPCNQEQIADFEARLAAAPEGTEVLYNLCNFPDPWHEDQFQDYLNALGDVVRNVPDSFNLTEELLQVEDATEGVGPLALKEMLRNIRTLAGWAWLVPLVLLALLVLLAVRSLKDAGRWLGAPLMVGGALALLPALVYRSVITGWLISGPLSEAPDLIRSEATRAILRLAAEVFRPLMFQALALLAVGLVLVVLMLVLGSKGKRSAVEVINEG